MNKSQSTDFRKLYNTLTEPTEVYSYGKLVGTWYPAGTEPQVIGKVPDSRQVTNWDTSWTPTFRPVPKSQKKR